VPNKRTRFLTQMMHCLLNQDCSRPDKEFGNLPAAASICTILTILPPITQLASPSAGAASLPPPPMINCTFLSRSVVIAGLLLALPHFMLRVPAIGGVLDRMI